MFCLYTGRKRCALRGILALLSLALIALVVRVDEALVEAQGLEEVELAARVVRLGDLDFRGRRLLRISGCGGRLKYIRFSSLKYF